MLRLVKPVSDRARLLLSVLFLSIWLVSCQGVAESTNTPLPGTKQVTPTIATPTLVVPTECCLTPTSVSPTPVSDDARQLTLMDPERLWWGEDSQTLYFSTVTQTWMIDLATETLYPAPDAQDPRYQARMQAEARVAPLIPAEANRTSVSPGGNKVIFSLPTVPTGPTVESCDGESCIPVPAYEIWLIDVESRQSVLLQVEGELVAPEVGFRWSDDETLVVITEHPFTWSEGYFWVADLPSANIYPMGARERWSWGIVWSISPDGEFVMYEQGRIRTEEEGWVCGVMYLLNTGSRERTPLPDVPCGFETGYFWLSDRAFVFSEKVEDRVVFWVYDTVTLERREIASSVTLPTAHCVYTLAPDRCTVAAKPIFSYKDTPKDTPSGIWLVSLDLCS